MKSFLEYLKEYEEQLEEDAVMATTTAANTGAEVAPPNAAANVRCADVASPDAMVGMTDHSVLGIPCKGKSKNNGFFGKGDFHILKNVLSGEVEKRIDHA